MILTANAGLEHYVRRSYANIRALVGDEPEQAASVQLLSTAAAIREAAGTGGKAGDSGYVNWRSGWADAEASMVYARRKVEALGRVRFVTDTVRRLLFSSAGDRVQGVQLASGGKLEAELTMVAAGAWTPALLDMRGIAASVGQVLGYLRLAPEERAALAAMPVTLNVSNGMFAIPPDNQNVLKVARHGYGYANPTTVPHPEPHHAARGEAHIVVSLPPAQSPETLPQEALRALHGFTADFFPSLPWRPFDFTRICWYTDTPTGDWILGYHPAYGRSLYVATGGSGHAFKFLPVIGEKIVQGLLGTLEKELVELWQWPSQRVDENSAAWTGDGSRGGRKGMVLEEEMDRGRSKL